MLINGTSLTYFELGKRYKNKNFVGGNWLKNTVKKVSAVVAFLEQNTQHANLKEARFTLAPGSKAETLQQRVLVEGNCSHHGGQEAGKEGRARDRQTLFQVNSSLKHLFQAGPTSL